MFDSNSDDQTTECLSQRSNFALITHYRCLLQCDNASLERLRTAIRIQSWPVRARSIALT